MKLAPIELELQKHKNLFTHLIVHTGQHYDYRLSSIFFRDLNLPQPHIFLGAGSGTHAEQTAKIMTEFENVVLKEKPDLVIVFGDINSTIACALVCSKIHYNSGTLPLAHVEAGLRSFDRTMPEEINRIVTDSLSEILFITEPVGVKNLLAEGIDKKKMYLVGDTMIDSLIYYRSKFESSKILNKLGLNKQNYLISTIHRPVNVDNKNNFNKIISILNSTAKTAQNYNPDTKIVLPIHPRTLKMAEKFSLLKKLKGIKNLITVEPLGYTDFIKLLMDSILVITDSGGIQEEATFLKIPCLTLRNTFERQDTINLGTNSLCGLDERIVINKLTDIYKGKYKKGKIPQLMDGKASHRIVNVLKNAL